MLLKKACLICPASLFWLLGSALREPSVQRQDTFCCFLCSCLIYWEVWLSAMILFSADHNSIHASDVLHGVFFMTTKEIPGFCPINSKLSTDSGSDSDSGLNGEGRQKTNKGDYGSLKDSIPLLELLALYTAATMHDYDHPGRTNAFLVATLSQQVSLNRRSGSQKAEGCSWN